MVVQYLTCPKQTVLFIYLIVTFLYEKYCWIFMCHLLCGLFKFLGVPHQVTIDMHVM